MAVYQGARPRSGISLRPGVAPRTEVAEPGPQPAAVPLPRRRVRASGTTRAGRRSNRVGIVLGGIVVVFLLAFFSLAQMMRASATAYEIERLSAQGDQLQAQLLDLRSNVNRLGREPAIRKLALDQGLGQLGAPIVVGAP
jgi:hypothetical protein